MTENNTTPRDATGRRALLAAAQADPRLGAETSDPTGFERAAHQLAVALGYCRLFGVACGRFDAPLAEPVARAACRRLATDLDRWARPDDVPNGDPLGDPDAEFERWDRPATGMADEWLDSPNPEEADEVASRWLVRRTDVLAAQVALAEAEQAIRVADPPAAAALSAMIDATEAGPLKRFDVLLERPRNKDVLGTLAGSTLASNLRGRLAGPHRERLPWWLDPTEMVPEVEPKPTRAKVAPPPVHAMAATPLSAPLSGADLAFRRPDRAAWVKISEPPPGHDLYEVRARDAGGEQASTAERIRIVVIDATGDELASVPSPNDSGGEWAYFEFTLPRKARAAGAALTIKSGDPEEEWEYVPTP